MQTPDPTPVIDAARRAVKASFEPDWQALPHSWSDLNALLQLEAAIRAYDAADRIAQQEAAPCAPSV